VSDQARRAIEAVWRIEAPRLLAGLARHAGGIGPAEDLAQDALVAALEQWPREGIPDNPGAWLAAVARRRAIDAARRGRALERKHGELGRRLELDRPAAEPDTPEEQIGDDLLALILVSCHPVLSVDARVALTLKLACGLRVEEIARALLAREPAIAQRIVRAKRTLAEAAVPFEVPPPIELGERVASALEVVYLLFNEGYAATAGEEWQRPDLCRDALRLGRVLSELLPAEPEVHGLVALMEIQASRSAARSGPAGEPVLLLDQDRARWDRLLIRRGLAALERAQQLGRGLGPYGLQAAIAACHARAPAAADTDWPGIVALYDALSQLAPSPVVSLNRAVAVAMAYGPAAALEIVDELAREPALERYHLLPSVRGELLARLGRPAAARAEFERAATLTRNERERAMLLARAEEAV
jgi:RNA polymerase sigma factor (sigma-70 family)